MGLPVPPAPPPTSSSNTRYMFQLARAQFNAGQVARLVGMRQYVTIGQGVENGEDSTVYPIERPIVTPSWRFPDGNISWHLRRFELQPNTNANTHNRSGLSFRNSGTPALLYTRAPDEMGGYASVRPPGNVVIPDLGNFHDIRFPWLSDRAWDSLDIEIRGPCSIGLFCSVQQTDPDSRVTLALTTPPAGGFGCLNPEDAFLLNFPDTVYTRVAGSLIFEDVAMLRDLSDPQPWGAVSPDCRDRDQPQTSPPSRYTPRSGRTPRPPRNL